MPFASCFDLRRVEVHQLLEHLRRKGRDALEHELLAFRERVADLEISGVVQADHIAGKRLVHNALARPQKTCRAGEADVLAQAHVKEHLVPLELAGADADKGDAVAMAGVQVRVDLEHEAGEILLVGIDDALVRGPAAGRGRDLGKGVEQFLDAEVVDGAAEEDRREFAAQVGA